MTDTPAITMQAAFSCDVGFATLGHVVSVWHDRPEVHAAIFDAFDAAVAASPLLLRHRRRIEAERLGFGDRPFHWLWKLLVDDLPPSFRFLEIGVYKGQVLSLVGLLAMATGRQATLIGVTPLSSLGDKYSSYDHADYAEIIRDLQEWSGLPGDRQARLVVGDSTDDAVKAAVRNFGKFDLVLIDGGHDYATVVNDIVVYSEMIGPGGYLVTSDSALGLALPTGLWPGHADVARAVNDILAPDIRFIHVCSVGHLRVWRKRAAPLRSPGPSAVPAAPARAFFPDLVMGFCAHYDASQVEPFVASLRRSAPDAELCLFCYEMKPDFIEIIRSYQIQTQAAAPYLHARAHQMFVRFVMYRDFLARQPHRYGRVLLTDVRDVIFQHDPFRVAWPAETVFAAEEQTIRNDPVNNGWLRRVYGPWAADRAADKRVVCAGTTFGTAPGIRRYLDVMHEEILHRGLDHADFLDQAVHNFVALVLQPSWAAVDHDNSIVATLGCIPLEAVGVRDRSIVVRDTVPAVLHQWDRHPSLREYVSAAEEFRYPRVSAGSAPDHPR